MTDPQNEMEQVKAAYMALVETCSGHPLSWPSFLAGVAFGALRARMSQEEILAVLRGDTPP